MLLASFGGRSGSTGFCLTERTNVYPVGGLMAAGMKDDLFATQPSHTAPPENASPASPPETENSPVARLHAL